MLRPLNCLILVALLTLTQSLAQADWLRFRGPNGSGIYTGEELPPTEWSPDKNLLWKTPLPGPGVSSPIVVGDRVFVTCYSGYGLDRRDPGDINNLKRHLVCIDRKTGYKVWEKTVVAAQPETPYSGMGLPEHGYATHTPVSDGERVYVFFGKSGALAFDMEGNQLWHTEVGKEFSPRSFGSSSSPILYKNVLIVTASDESQALVGLDTKTGEELWRKEASGLSDTFSTPVLSKVGEDTTELIVGVPREIWAFDPLTGKFHGYAEVPSGDQSNASVITKDGVVYVVQAARRSGGSAAVKVSSIGDKIEPNVLWTGRPSGSFGSPILHEGRLYNMTERMVTCYDAENGDLLYEQRIPDGGRSETENNDRNEAENDNQDEERTRRFGQGGRRFGGRGGRGGGGGGYSSPVMAGGKIYYVTESGETIVLKPGEKIELVARNIVTEDNESFKASPAVSDGAIFLRSDKHLYCIAEQPAEESKSDSESSD